MARSTGIVITTSTATLSATQTTPVSGSTTLAGRGCAIDSCSIGHGIGGHQKRRRRRRKGGRPKAAVNTSVSRSHAQSGPSHGSCATRRAPNCTTLGYTMCGKLRCNGGRRKGGRIKRGTATMIMVRAVFEPPFTTALSLLMLGQEKEATAVGRFTHGMVVHGKGPEGARGRGVRSCSSVWSKCTTSSTTVIASPSTHHPVGRFFTHARVCAPWTSPAVGQKRGVEIGARQKGGRPRVSHWCEGGAAGAGVFRAEEIPGPPCGVANSGEGMAQWMAHWWALLWGPLVLHR